MVLDYLEKDCDEECPIAVCAEIIEGKWTTLIFRELYNGKRRYSHLQRALIGISPRMLALRLRFLEEKGLLTRSVYPTIPPSTEYELSETGVKIKSLLEAMAVFGQELRVKKKNENNTI